MHPAVTINIHDCEVALRIDERQDCGFSEAVLTRIKRHLELRMEHFDREFQPATNAPGYDEVAHILDIINSPL